MQYMKTDVWVVIPNFNGAKDLPRAIDAVLAQSLKELSLVVVDNGSTDGSRGIIEAYERKDARVRSIYLDKNYGFTGGMNPGLALAITAKAAFVAGCNNDAQPDKHWLKHLVTFLVEHPAYGVAACKQLSADGKTIDSVGEEYSVWGLAFPKGRDQPAHSADDQQTELFAASGGASLYRVKMLRQIGLFDQDFFAYNEDVDLSFRAQLRGWKIALVPSAVIYHERGQTANMLGSGFRTYQTTKNLPFVLWKNLPTRYIWRVLPRLMLAQTLFVASAVQRGQGWSALKGLLVASLLLPKKLIQRRRIQRSRTISPQYIWRRLYHDLPPDAHRLRAIRTTWRKLIGRRPA